jgi:methionine-rich copper-binding protein CopC
MSRHMKSKSVLFAASLVAALVAAGTASADVFHFALSKSVPAADASVPAPEEVRLWFTQVPQENSVSIRVIDASGEAVPSTEPSQDPDDPMVTFVRPTERLEAGSYTVSWRGIGDDGHVVRGDFAFSVTAE